jgi:glycosyltransferase involved in cell wall biosynthesis
MPHLTFTVTNDLTFDQRMQRCCAVLAAAGYEVTLVGRELPTSQPLQATTFAQKRLRCWAHAGKLFYIEYNIRLFFYLLFAKTDAYIAIDLDTILPNFYCAKLRHRPIVYDAHEYFSELPEVVNRPAVKRAWEAIAAHTIPRIPYCYTVCHSLAEVFTQRYGVPFAVFRNMPFAQAKQQNLGTALDIPPADGRKIIIYQGYLNDGRGLEELLCAMPHLPDAVLWLVGEGDNSAALRQQTADLQLTDRVIFLGRVLPKDLPQLTQQAYIGVNLLQNKGLNYYYSLANKFFDYVQAHKPALTVTFPEYLRLVAEYEVAICVNDLQTATLVTAIRRLFDNAAYYAHLQAECERAAAQWTWEQEAKELVEFYNIALAKPENAFIK